AKTLLSPWLGCKAGARLNGASCAGILVKMLANHHNVSFRQANEGGTRGKPVLRCAGDPRPCRARSRADGRLAVRHCRCEAEFPGLWPALSRGAPRGRERPPDISRAPTDPQIRADRAAAPRASLWRVRRCADVRAASRLCLAGTDLRAGSPPPRLR